MLPKEPCASPGLVGKAHGCLTFPVFQGVRVNVAFFVELFKVAVTVTFVLAVTLLVVTANEVPVEPGGTVTDAGTVTRLLPLCRLTTSPFGPALYWS